MTSVICRYQKSGVRLHVNILFASLASFAKTNIVRKIDLFLFGVIVVVPNLLLCGVDCVMCFASFH